MKVKIQRILFIQFMIYYFHWKQCDRKREKEKKDGHKKRTYNVELQWKCVLSFGAVFLSVWVPPQKKKEK